jgi:hypothetical protein
MHGVLGNLMRCMHMKKNEFVSLPKNYRFVFNRGPPPISTGDTRGRQMTLDTSYKEDIWPSWSVRELKTKEFGWIVQWRLRADSRTRGNND